MAIKNYNMKFTMSNGQVINCPFTIPAGSVEGLSKVEWVNSLLSDTDNNTEIDLTNVSKLDFYLFTCGFNDSSLTIFCNETLFNGHTMDSYSLLHIAFCNGVVICTEYGANSTKSSYSLASDFLRITLSGVTSTSYIQLSGCIMYD